MADEQIKGTRSAEVSLWLGPEQRVFRLTVPMLEKVQEATDAGPPELIARMAGMLAAPAGMSNLQRAVMGGLGRWRVQDIHAPILFGLIGGGMDPPAAARIVEEWVSERPLIESVPVALAALMAAVFGPEDEPLGEPTAGEAQPSRRSRAASTGSRRSTARRRSSASAAAT